ncbi:MAG TPA: ribonuclease R [Candidatus Alistipes intestinigallinarum]|uniref:Ribonuclease R n=1 Tax=Candidatus Alistipes intestinigallinarum TaxID=2838440 RepID=A0A9D2CCK1_9BACT|nr:ribonuclease R [Candidatus Alistipes intestinigallinarum]
MNKKQQRRSDKGAKGAKRSDRAEIILHLFRDFPNTQFTLKYLASVSGGASKEGRRETFEILSRLFDEGIVEECAREKYRLSQQHRPHYEGVASMTQSGSVYVAVEGLENDIFVQARNAYNALDGDRVEVSVIHRGRDGQFEGEITRIIERSRKPYVGVAEVGAHQIFVRADSRRMPMDIYLSKRTYPDVRDGEKVVVRIVDWQPGSKSPVGELVERLGIAGNNDTEMHAILAEYELPYRFEPEVEEAAAAIDGRVTAREIAQRRDFRKVTTFTVDPADAKDFDDALSVRKIKDGVWEIGVHIADVTHYVKPHSVIDDEAVERGTSVYLVDRTVPMLPERLSNELCSLRPNETSLCFSAVFTLNENLEILDEWFGRTVIHSDRRFTYAEAQEVIETGRGDFAEEILTLNRLAQALRAQRFKNGAISFEREEVKFRLDEDGKPLGVYFKEQKESNQMIEEFMLLANRRVAEFCAHRRNEKGRAIPRTMVFRVHDAPSEEKLDRFRQFILRFGHVFKASKGRAVAREMNKLFKQIKGSTEENAVSTMAVRSMAKAFYTTDNIGHYGLAFQYYTHFTSPIRRYPDMMVHRLLAHYLAGGKSVEKEPVEDLCARASDREIVAAEAERASIKYKMVEFMKQHIGEEFDGHISGLTEWGVYVELDETHIEGMSFLRDIEGDFFLFDEQQYEIIGRSTGIRLTLGDAVRIRVKRADLQKRQLDFELLLPGVEARRSHSADVRGKGKGKSPKVSRSTRRNGR